MRGSYNFCNSSERMQLAGLFNAKKRDFDIRPLYIYLCPVIIVICFFSIIFNAILISISRQSKVVNKSPILLLSLNLAVTDLIASLLNGLGILFNSYLPEVYDVKMGQCSMLMFEVVRYAALVASALHLLALAFVHYRGIVNPLHYRSKIFFSQHLSRAINCISIACWVIPLAIMIVWFSYSPCQGFQTAECDYLFMLGFTFRYTILSLFALPLMLMSAIYLRIFIIISRHQRGRRMNQERSTLTRGVMTIAGPIGTAAAVDLPALMAQSGSGKCPACEARGLAYQDPTTIILSESEDEDEGRAADELTVAQPVRVIDTQSLATGNPMGATRPARNQSLGSVSNWSQSSISRDSFTFKSRPTDSTATRATKATQSSSNSSASSVSSSDGSCERGRSASSDGSRRTSGQKSDYVNRRRSNRRPVKRNDCDQIDSLTTIARGADRDLGSLAKDTARVNDRIEITSTPSGDGQSPSGALASSVTDDKQTGDNGLTELAPVLKEQSVLDGVSLVETIDSVVLGGEGLRTGTGVRTRSCRDADGPRTKKILRAQFSLGAANNRSKASTQKEVRLLTSSASRGQDQRLANNRPSRKANMCEPTSAGYTHQSFGHDCVAISRTTSANHNSSTAKAPNQRDFRKGCTCDNKLTDSLGGDDNGAGARLLSRSQTVDVADNSSVRADKSRPGSRQPPGKAATLLTMSSRSQGSSISPTARGFALGRGISLSLKNKLCRSRHPATASGPASCGPDVDLCGDTTDRTLASKRRSRDDAQGSERTNTEYSVTSTTYEPTRRHIHASAMPQTNTKALVTTLLILGTYFISYVPAIIYQVLTCIDSCPYPLYDISFSKRVLLGAMTTLLLIAKSIIDPFIYSYRSSEIQGAISRYLSKRRSKSSSMMTSIHTSQRFTMTTNPGAGPGQSFKTRGANNSAIINHSRVPSRHDFGTNSLKTTDSNKILNHHMGTSSSTKHVTKNQVEDRASQLVVYNFTGYLGTNGEDAVIGDDNIGSSKVL